MALRLRKSFISSFSLIKHRSFSAIPSSASSVLLKPSLISSPARTNPNFRIPSLSFRSSSISLSSRSNQIDDQKISPDTILFEGCDYNHWLITMDFPKDPKPTPEEMVETYVQTLAKVVGSVEEAKKRMYACSTTTYTGFQAVMTEEMSEKFRGLPGVVFILPDSYIDPVNKEYGGDKYINGTIIPRPPPVQYNNRRTRYDQNRNNDRQMYDRPRDPRPMPQAGNAPYDRQGPMQGDGRNYMPQQNYGQTGQDGRGYGPPASREFNPTVERGDFGRGERRDYGQAGGRDPMPMGGRSYPPVGRDNYQGERRDPVPSYERGYSQGERRDPMPMSGRDYPPGGRDSYQGERRDPVPSYQRDYPPPEHRDFRGDYRGAGPPGGVDYRQGMGSGYGQGYTGPNERQGFSQVEHRDGMQGEQRNFSPVGQTGVEQGRY
eukprot:TRINITY_DN266_c0_g1_i1.p1 TRINITY_DN266_c0_g1~~TRINITY_DN266_c0_g1_i1.p1  ORF type:complete len:433 (+),score=91.73 TRINITY_DN266_c0_g1_i1:113-1411(+)